MTRHASIARCALVMAALAATLAGLLAAGRPLGSPPVTSWTEASEWYEAVGPATATVAVVRLLALAAIGWLLLAAGAELLASSAPTSGAGALADLIAPRSLQRIVHGLAGLSLTAGLTATAPSAGTPGDAEEGVAILRLVDDEEDASEGTATLRIADEPPHAPAAPTPPPVPAEAGVVTVEPGDSLWSIAEEALAEARGAGRPPATDAEVAVYWRRVVEANRTALVDRTNPDLIYPGQVMALPAP